MPILVTDINTGIKADEQQALAAAEKLLSPYGAVKKLKIYKTSLDARKRNDIHKVHTVYAEFDNAYEEKRICEASGFKYVENVRFSPKISSEKRNGRVVIAGFGPAGMFCGLALAENGYRPIILERGEPVEKRAEKVNCFWNGGQLDLNTNVQFGEGGAGTFSDGKLTTRIKDPLCRYVLEKFAEFGAPEEILYKAKPHIGTDKLRLVVRNIRERILSLGGEIHFLSKLEDFELKDSYVRSVSSGGNSIETSAVVLAVGHSARDTFEMLLEKGIFLEAKPFSVGARIEHLQWEVDRSLYGKFAGDPSLPTGEYQLSYRDRAGRGCYTFCMCPGGYVVPSSSEEGGIVTNGMSEFSRNGKNANAAIVVSVTPDDFGKGPLDGVEFARKIEKNAFSKTGNYSAPGVTVGELLGRGKAPAAVIPTYCLGVELCGLDGVLPKFVIEHMKTGLRVFGNKMDCFKNMGAILTAPETRTSSPVRIPRTEKGSSVSAGNLYPCGEGSGHAGGIMSSAVDGLKTALHIMESFAP